MKYLKSEDLLFYSWASESFWSTNLDKIVSKGTRNQTTTTTDNNN